MWNCEITPANGDSVQKIDDISLEFQTGSEPDRIGTAAVQLAHLRTPGGGSLGTMAIGNIDKIKITENGMQLQGPIVEVAPNGLIEARSSRRETWNFTIIPTTNSE